MTITKQSIILFVVLLLLIVVIALLAMISGPADITINQVVHILFAGPDSSNSELFSSSQHMIIWNLRFPRILSAIVAGCTLAVCGTVFQAVFRNPMADPYVLGISSGAAFSVALAAFFGLIGHVALMWDIPLAAGIGAIGTALLVFALSGGMRRSVTTLLLTGVALNFLLSAAMTLFLYLNRSQLHSIIQWSLGSLATSTWNKLAIMGIISVASTGLIMSFSREMDILLLDEGSAISVGLPLKKVRIILLALSSVATSAIVSFCGIIGFVGLMVPHIIRLVVGPLHKKLLPNAMAGGALMMLCADTISRNALGSTELPVGVVTSLAGAPLFIVMLANYRKGIRK